MSLFDRIIAARGIDPHSINGFLKPDYSGAHDPFLLFDMEKAVDRLAVAHKNQEHIVIYGDYDIDGLTSVALLLDAFEKFGFKSVNTFMPNRFIEGYGMTLDSIEQIAKSGANLIVTVDCGSLSIKEVARANELGVDVIVTDHHNVSDDLPAAIAVINPKRVNSKYPFIDLAGVGVAFKLVQAMQTRLVGLPHGQEKWLLDLVALGTVCDIVELLDENRANVYWGLKVLSKTRRPGLKALMAVSKIDPMKISTRSLGFGLGPRMNASGRIETAQHALDLLVETDTLKAFDKAQYLDSLNISRRSEQDKIFKSAIIQAEKYKSNPVLIVSGVNWNHGIVGIVASKLLEKYNKPVVVLQEMGEESKGSARSFGDFNIADAIKYSADLIVKGGGHSLAAGVTLPTKNIDKFRKRINDFYIEQNLNNQQLLLLPKADADAELDEVTEDLVNLINQLEPFGNGNPQPILKSSDLIVVDKRELGSDSQHIKLSLKNSNGSIMQFIAFNAPKHFFVSVGDVVTVWYQALINEWRDRRTVEGSLLHLELRE